MAKYLKLGPKATSFFDPTTQVLLRNNEVLKFDRIPQSKKLTVAIAQGHVQRATEEEYLEFTQGKAPKKEVEAPAPPPPLPSQTQDERVEYTPEEWAAYVEKSGFLKKDKTKILGAKNREDAIAIYDEIDKTYYEE